MKSSVVKKPTAAQAAMDLMRSAAQPKGDKLETAREMVRQLRDREFEAAQLEERLDDTKRVIQEMKERSIPAFLDEAGVPAITLAAEGNMPAFEIAVFDRYHANIPSETQDEAYEYLMKTGNADLIKTTFTISFGLKESAAAERFKRSLDKAGIEHNAKCAVPWNTLTSWFKAEHKKKPLPAKVRDLLGATVGRVVKVVKQKETR